MPLENPRDSTVKVFVFPGGDPEFTLESDLLKNGELTFKNGGGHKGYVVDFVLANADQTGYYFPDSELLALSSEELPPSGDPKCPAQGKIWDEFKPVAVSSDNKTLTVHNENGKKKRFGYSLFVTQDPKKPKPRCKALDPIGNNQNGDRYPIMKAAAAFVGIAAAGAALYTCSRLGD